jgi:hypothetical protein
MGLLKLTPIRNDGVGYIDNRGSLYYGKYNYRARIYCEGITMCWYVKSANDIDSYIDKRASRWKNANIESIKKFLDWKSSLPIGKDRTHTIRMEGNIASIFSNDLDFLKQVENFDCEFDYTEVDTEVPKGTKYFVKEPTHKYRIYLKSKRVDDKFKDDLYKFIDRYKDTETVIVPSNALNNWLLGKSKQYYWYGPYCSSHYFIDYNDDSITTLISIMFGDMVKSRFKLEKRPEQ